MLVRLKRTCSTFLRRTVGPLRSKSLCKPILKRLASSRPRMISSSASWVTLNGPLTARASISWLKCSCKSHKLPTKFQKFPWCHPTKNFNWISKNWENWIKIKPANLKLHRNAKHNEFCFERLSADGSSCYENTLLPEPCADEDTLHLQALPATEPCADEDTLQAELSDWLK